MRFAQRVKNTRNVVTVNAEMSGSTAVLQKEIDSLKRQLVIQQELMKNISSANPASYNVIAPSRTNMSYLMKKNILINYG